MNRIPWITLACLAAVPFLWADAAAVLTALTGAVMIGLPFDAFRRSGRVSVALSWVLVPICLATMLPDLLHRMQNPDDLFYLSWLRGLDTSHALLAGLALGIAVCSILEWVEQRSRVSPSRRPLQLLGLIFGLLVARHLFFPQADNQPDNWLGPAIVATVAWLIVRLLRTMLRLNSKRQEIESYTASGGVSPKWR